MHTGLHDIHVTKVPHSSSEKGSLRRRMVLITRFDFDPAMIRIYDP